MKSRLQLLMLLTLMTGTVGANAGLIASYGTGTTGSAIGGTLTSDALLVDVYHPAYYIKSLGPASNWVWGNDPTGFATINFTFSFDLTGYDLATASLSGVWGADNIGSVTLNGNLLSSLQTVLIDNFYTATPFSASTANLFNQGVNTLVFSVSNRGGVGGFRSAGIVTAEPAPELLLASFAAVPAPNSLALAGLALAGLGFSYRRKA